MSASSHYLEVLLAAIQLKHECGAAHLESVAVKEETEGQTIWAGGVEVFELAGHDGAKRCYAWMEGSERGQHRFVTVLQKGFVISPESAVKAWLASKSVTIHPVVRDPLDEPASRGSNDSFA